MCEDNFYREHNAILKKQLEEAQELMDEVAFILILENMKMPSLTKRSLTRFNEGYTEYLNKWDYV